MIMDEIIMRPIGYVHNSVKTKYDREKHLQRRPQNREEVKF